MANETCFFFEESLEQTEAAIISNILTSILNSVFLISAMLGNFIVILVILKSSELHSPSFVLLGCLATSDFLVGLVCQPTFVALKITELLGYFSVYCTLRQIQSSCSWIASGASLFTLCGVAIEKLLCLTLHLRYKALVTVPRVLITVAIFWVICITCVMMRFWSPYMAIVGAVIFPVLFFTVTLSNLKILQIVRKHKRQIGKQQQTVAQHVTSVNAMKCRKSALTVLYVYGLFLIFYFPFFVVMIVQNRISFTRSVRIAYDYAATVVFINSALNPIIYCWRIGEIRRAVRKTLKKLYVGGNDLVTTSINPAVTL